MPTYKANAQIALHLMIYYWKLNNAQYVSLIDMSSGYHNLKLDEKSSYLTTVTRKFGRYRYKKITSLEPALAGDMFQQKIR